MYNIYLIYISYKCDIYNRKEFSCKKEENPVMGQNG